MWHLTLSRVAQGLTPAPVVRAFDTLRSSNASPRLQMRGRQADAATSLRSTMNLGKEQRAARAPLFGQEYPPTAIAPVAPNKDVSAAADAQEGSVNANAFDSKYLRAIYDHLEGAAVRPGRLGQVQEPEQLVSIDLGNTRALRTQDEATLHDMIESHLHIVEQSASQSARNSDKPIDRKAAAQPTPATHGLWEQFNPNEVNVARFERDLVRSGAVLHHISGENNNCAFRAGWLSAFIQCKDPAALRARLYSELSDTLDARNPARLYPRTTDTLPHPTVAQQIEVVHKALCNFKRGDHRDIGPGSANTPFSKQVDDAISVLSQALLVKELNDMPPHSQSIYDQDLAEIERTTIGPEQGNTGQLSTIMRKLGADMVVMSTANGVIEVAATADSVLNDVPVRRPAVIASADRIAQDAANHAARVARARALLRAASHVPTLKHYYLHKCHHFALYA